jgi:hypothetical protein
MDSTMPLILYAGDKQLGTLTFQGVDHPRTYYSFEPAPAFKAFQDILDLRGRHMASEENMAAAEKLDLRVIAEDGTCRRLEFIFIDGNGAVIRAGFVRAEPEDGNNG